ncbi:DUF3168 domain-containing protein [Shimia sediminis]|uniref:DUF3168 domain-containing protein n=1 Tax=Shimia sediminis TaxID=2497945 RepID=UPI000F8CC3C7|nr:DUF3168 domain-containing protein [Shimia sediminis]
MSVDLVVQKAIRARLVATQAVTDLVPAVSILDRNQRPAPNPSIILGESQMVDEDAMHGNRTRVYHTIHIWKREASLEGVKRIAGAVRNALHWSSFDLDTGYHAVNWHVSNIRPLRDPDGETSHAIVTVEVLVSEALS